MRNREITTPDIQGMAVYKIFVGADGTLQKHEPVSVPDWMAQLGNEALQSWSFAPITNHGVAVQWWSVLGLCYASGWHQALPCNPAYTRSNPSSTPDRLYLRSKTIVRNLIPGSTVDFSGTPLHKIEGLNLEYPPQAMTSRVQGQVQLAAVVDSQGKVTNVSIIYGHPMLTGNAVNDIKSWRFAPVRFLDHPAEVELQLSIQYQLPEKPGVSN